VLDYFVDRVSTLHPNFKKTKLWATLNANLREARNLSVKDDRSPPDKEVVKKLHVLAKATNDALSVPEE
jgi:hypothetical protein